MITETERKVKYYMHSAWVALVFEHPVVTIIAKWNV
jgi:hypothetical protein